MAWIKIDDQFADHPKVRSVGPFGAALQVAAFCHCGKYLTDGFLSFAVAEALAQALACKFGTQDGKVWTPALTCGMVGRDAREMDWAKIMVDARLWDEAPGGYVVHDYLDYNPSKEEVLAQRAARSAAGRAGGLISKRSSKTEASAQANDKQTLKQNESKIEAKLNPVPLPHKSTTHSLELLKTEKNSKTAMSNASRAPARGSGQVVDNSQRNGTAPTPGQRPNFSPELTEEIVDFLDELNGIFSLNDNDRIGIRSDIRQHGTTADLSYIPDQLRMAKADGRLGRSPGIANPVGWIRNQIQELTNDASPNYDPG